MEKSKSASIKERRRFWEHHLEQCRASGLSQAEYCRRHGLSIKSFGYRKPTPGHHLQRKRERTASSPSHFFVSRIAPGIEEQKNASPRSDIGLHCGRRSGRCREDTSPGHSCSPVSPTGTAATPPVRSHGQAHNPPKTREQGNLRATAQCTRSTVGFHQAKG